MAHLKKSQFFNLSLNINKKLKKENYTSYIQTFIIESTRSKRGYDSSLSIRIGASFADLWKMWSIRRVPAGTGFSETETERFWSVAGRSEGCEDGMGSESRRKSLVGWCFLTAIRMCSSFTIFRFLSVVISADFSARNWRKSSAEHVTRNRASEFTLLMSLSSFMIFLTLPIGSSGWIASAFSSSAIDAFSSSAIDETQSFDFGNEDGD